MKVTSPRRLAAFAFALFHLLLVGLAPIADAALEMELIHEATSAVGDSSEGSAPTSSEDRDSGAPTHVDCLLCVLVRAAAERIDPLVLEASYVAACRADSDFNATPAQSRTTAAACSRAPPIPITA